MFVVIFFFSSRRRHTRFDCDWSSDVCSSDLRARKTEAMAAKMPRYGTRAESQNSLAAAPATRRAATSEMANCAKHGVLRRSEERRVGKECRSRWSRYE